MLKDFFIPTQKNNYYPYAVRHKSLYTYALFMLIFNVFAVHFFSLFAPRVLADSLYATTDIISLTNQDREQNALPDLSEDKRLDSAAYAKALDMFQYDYWAHINPVTGNTPWNFIIKSGFDYKFAGENLANGFSTAEDVNNAWLNSPEHKSNLLGSNYKHIGVAVVRGNLQHQDVILVVQMFGTLQSEVNVTPMETPSISVTAPPPSLTPTKILVTPSKVINGTLTPTTKILSSTTSTPPITTIVSTTITPTKLIPQQLGIEQSAKSKQPAVKQTTDMSLKVQGVQFANRINFFIIFFLLIIFGLDTIYYMRIRKIHARTKPLSITHLPILAIVAIICLIQSTGIIL